MDSRGLVFSGLKDRVWEDSSKPFHFMIWMFNPINKTTEVRVPENKHDKSLGVTKPWNFQQKSIPDSEIGPMVGTVDSPKDWWTFRKGDRKPIAEVNYTAVPDLQKHTSQVLLDTWIPVVAEIEIYHGNIEPRQYQLPVRIFRPTGSKFFEEDSVDLGIITSPTVAHKYPFRLGNKLSEPVVVLHVSITKQCKGMNIKFATPFSFKIPIPADSEPFDFLWLFAHPDRKSSVGFCQGEIQLKFDVSGKLETYKIPFTAGYYKHLLADDEGLSFQLTRRHQEGSRLINKFEGKWKSKFPIDLVIHNLTFPKDSKIAYRPNAKNLRLSPGAEVSSAFSVEYSQDENDFVNKYTSSYEFGVVSALGTQISMLLRYYTLGLMCAQHNNIGLRYEKCKPVENISFGYIAVSQRKVITMDIFNPTMLNYIIKRVEFKEKNSDVEISFENQSKLGMKSYYKKANKTMNTFFLIPKGEVVSIRVKVRPRYSGSFRDSVTIYLSRGEINLQISYDGINGGLEFSPPVLKYDLFYPVESDELQVSVMNHFNAEIEIVSARAPQNFLFANMINNRKIPAKSKTPFLNVIMDLTKDELKNSSRPNYLRALHQKALPALSDLIHHTDQQRGWQQIMEMKQTETTGEIIVQTELMSDLKIHVKGTLRKASLVPQEQLNLGPLEEQRLHYISVNLTNPTKHNITMRFFLADDQMLNAEALRIKVERRLKKRYAKFKNEVICVVQRHLTEEEIKYFMNVIFEGVKPVPRIKPSIHNQYCFVVNNTKASSSKFFDSHSNFLFDVKNISRYSRKWLMQENDDIYYLKDVIRISRRSPPTNPQSLFGLSFMEKLSVLYSRLVSQLGEQLIPRTDRKVKKKAYYLSSLAEADFQKYWNTQEIFLNPKFRYRNVTLAPQQQISLPLLICRPKEASDIENANMSLLIKNDYSNLAIVPIKVKLGKVALIVDKSITVSEDNRVTYPQFPEEHYQLVFTVHPNDIVQKLSKSDPKRIAFKKGTRRLFELKNIGNLPIKVKEVVAGEGCSFSGFKITNCQGFELSPNQSHRLEIVLARPNDFEIDFKKEVKLILEGRVLTFQFRVQANPLSTSDPASGGFTLMELASKSFTETASNAYKYIAILFLIILVVLFMKHYQEKTYIDPNFVVTSLDQLRYRSEYFCDNIFDINYLESTLKYKSLEAQKNKHIRNIGLKQLMTPTQPDRASRDASINSENQDSEPPTSKRNKASAQPIRNKQVGAQPNTGSQRPTPTNSDQKPTKGEHTAAPVVEESPPHVPLVNLDVLQQKPPTGKAGKKKKPKRSEHGISELTSPRIDENLTQNILAQLDAAEPSVPVVHPTNPSRRSEKVRKDSAAEHKQIPEQSIPESQHHRKQGHKTKAADPPQVDQLEVEAVEPEEEPQQPEEVIPQSPDPTVLPEPTPEPVQPERNDAKIRSRKTSGVQRQSGAQTVYPATKTEYPHQRGGKKVVTPQSRSRHTRNRKYSRSDDEESEETFVPKHQVVNTNQNHNNSQSRDASVRQPVRAVEPRDHSEDSEPEYRVKESQPTQKHASPVQNAESQGHAVQLHVDNQKPQKEESLHSEQNRGSSPTVQGAHARRGADKKPASRGEKEVSPKRNKEKKKAEVVYYQRVEKPRRDEVSESTGSRTKDLVAGEQHSGRVAGDSSSRYTGRGGEGYGRAEQHSESEHTDQLAGRDPKRGDASFLEEEGPHGQQFNQNMISFNNQDISAIDNMEDGASNTSQVFPTREDLPARDRLAHKAGSNKRAEGRNEEPESEEEGGYINKSREHIRKQMEMDGQGSRSHIDDSSMQDEDPINKRVGAIGGRKHKTPVNKDKQRQAIGSGAQRNASLAGFRQAENVYQPFGGVGSGFAPQRALPANHYHYPQYDPSYAANLYDPYRQSAGYNQPAFRASAGFAPPFYPHEPQPFYPTAGPMAPKGYAASPTRPGLKMYNNPYGALLMREGPPPESSGGRGPPGPSPPGFMYEYGQKSQAMHGGVYEDAEGEGQEGNIPGYTFPGMDDDDPYEPYADYAHSRPGLDDSFAASKQFKPALNNPFTLSGLGNTLVGQQVGSPGSGYQEYPLDYGWGKAQAYGGSDYREGSQHSHSRSASSRNMSQLRPPPGLAGNDDEPEVRERQTQEILDAKREPNSNSDAGRAAGNTSQPQGSSGGRQRGNAKQQFSLFG